MDDRERPMSRLKRKSLLPSSLLKKKKKKPLRGLSLKRLFKSCMRGFFILVFLWLCLSDTPQKLYEQSLPHFYSLTAHHGLSVQHISIEGNFHTLKKSILKKVRIKPGVSIFQYSPQAIKNQVEQLPWVRSAKVQRVFPKTIALKISEKFPLALWQQNQKLILVDDQGHLIPSINPTSFSYLPIVIGEKAAQKAPALFSALSSQPHLQKRLSAAILVSDRRWDLIFNKTLRVKLPEKNIPVALISLTKLEQDKHINMDDIVSIDLRVSDRLYIHLKKKAAAARKSASRKKRV